MSRLFGRQSLIRVILLFSFFEAGLLSIVQAQNVNLEEPPAALRTQEKMDHSSERQTYLRLMSATSALESGFSSIANEILSSLLNQDTGYSLDTRKLILENLILAKLNLGQLTHAQDRLDELKSISEEPYPFLDLLVLFYRGNRYDEIGAFIDTDISNLSAAEQNWVDLIHGLWLIHENRSQEGKLFVDKALMNASSAYQRSWMDTLIWREEILSGEASQTLEVSLKTQLENAVNPTIASQLTQQYAIVLNAQRKKEEAIRVVERQLSVLGEDLRDQKDRLFMFLALLSGKNSGKSQYAIEQILLRGKSERVRSLAFYYWLSSVDFSSDENQSLLVQLSMRNNSDPLRNQYLYIRALTGFNRGDFELSRSLIDEVLSSATDDDFLQRSALRVLVGVCWSQPEPQYRLAAQHLQRLREMTESDQEKQYFTLLIADSYYLNSDYESALGYYQSLLSTSLEQNQVGEILFKVTNCYLAIGNTGGAKPILDEFQQIQNEMHEFVWGSEWNYNLQLINEGKSDEAIERLKTIQSRFDFSNAESNFEDWMYLAHLRVTWLIGFLYYQQSSFADCSILCQQSLNQLSNYPDLEREKLSVVYDELRILLARSLLETDKANDAISLLHEVRLDGNPDSAATTYMLEARYLWSRGDLVNAQRILIRLVDQFPNSEYAPVALYEAAINIESRETESSDQEAIALYERIANDFPDHPLHFISKLRQGDLLRKSNQFALAIPFYENLLVEFENDHRLYMVQMALGECYLALGSTRADYVSESIRILERIYDLNHLPLEVRLEAGTKTAVGLLRVNRNYRAEEILWRVIGLVKSEQTNHIQLGATGKYWLARAVLMLSERLNSSGHYQEKRQLVELAEQMKLPGLNLIKK